MVRFIYPATQFNFTIQFNWTINFTSATQFTSTIQFNSTSQFNSPPISPRFETRGRLLQCCESWRGGGGPLNSNVELN